MATVEGKEEYFIEYNNKKQLIEISNGNKSKCYFLSLTNMYNNTKITINTPFNDNTDTIYIITQNLTEKTYEMDNKEKNLNLIFPINKSKNISIRIPLDIFTFNVTKLNDDNIKQYNTETQLEYYKFRCKQMQNVLFKALIDKKSIEKFDLKSSIIQINQNFIINYLLIDKKRYEINIIEYILNYIEKYYICNKCNTIINQKSPYCKNCINFYVDNIKKNKCIYDKLITFFIDNTHTVEQWDIVTNDHDLKNNKIIYTFFWSKFSKDIHLKKFNIHLTRTDDGIEVSIEPENFCDLDIKLYIIYLYSD